MTVVISIQRFADGLYGVVLDKQKIPESGKKTVSVEYFLCALIILQTIKQRLGNILEVTTAEQDRARLREP